MAFLDGEMAPGEEREFRRLMENHPEWLEEVEEMAELVEATDRLRVRVTGSTLENYWEEIESRIQRRVGWMVLLVGSLALIGFGFVKVLAYAQNDFVRSGILLVALGLVALFLAVLRGRVLDMRRDRYSKVQR